MTHLNVSAAQSQTEPALLQAIESEIIPRLLLAHRLESRIHAPCDESRVPPITDAELLVFARIAVCQDLPGALDFVERLCRRGTSVEGVLLDLIGPTARLLGEQWQADLCSFTEVCAGLGTLQQVVHVIGSNFTPALPHRGLVVLVAVLGEQHTLGLCLVGEFLRRAGWGVQFDPDMSEGDLVRLVAAERVEMVGISVSNTELLRPLAALIAAVRKASRNHRMMVMLGGPVDLKDYAAQHGAVVCAADPLDAVRCLEMHATVPCCRS